MFVVMVQTQPVLTFPVDMYVDVNLAITAHDVKKVRNFFVHN
jgi:hypothetical protein